MIKDAVQFIKDVRVELSKVMWPKFDEYIGSTLIVLILVAFFSVYLFLIDQGFSWCAKFIFKLYGEY